MMKSLEVPVIEKAVIPGSREAVFEFIAAEDVLPKVLTGYGPLPGVTRTSENTGPWDKPGSARLIHLADGSTVREQVLVYDPPRAFAYRVWDFGNPLLSKIATGAKGEWVFTTVPTGTAVIWTYTFTAKNRLAVIPLRLIARFLWSGYMRVCLQNSQRLMSRRAKQG